MTSKTYGQCTRWQASACGLNPIVWRNMDFFVKDFRQDKFKKNQKPSKNLNLNIKNNQRINSRMAAMAPQWQGILAALVPLMREFLVAPTMTDRARSSWVRQIVNRHVNGGSPVLGPATLEVFVTARQYLLLAGLPTVTVPIVLEFLWSRVAIEAACILSDSEFKLKTDEPDCLELELPSAGLTNAITELTHAGTAHCLRECTSLQTTRLSDWIVKITYPPPKLLITCCCSLPWKNKTRKIKYTEKRRNDSTHKRVCYFFFIFPKKETMGGTAYRLIFFCVHFSESQSTFIFFVQDLGYHEVRLQVLSFAELTAEGALKVVPR